MSDSTLPGDRDDKGRIYAGAGIPWYWIVNRIDRQVEVYTSPSGPRSHPAYAQRTDHPIGDQVGVILDGAAIAQVAVQDLLPG